MDALQREFRYVVRSLLRSPGFFAVTALTLALGIGATTAIFSVIHGVLLAPLPYPQPERIVQLWQLGATGNRMQVSDPNFDDWRAQTRGFSALAQFSNAMTVSVAGTREPVRAKVVVVSRDFFAALGVRPLLGRAFVAEEQQPGGAPAVVVSHAFWRQQLGGDRSALGRAVTFDDRAYSVVGVMPPALDLPEGTDLWAPRELQPPLPSRTAHNWRVLGRLADGVTLEQARRELSTVSRQLKRQYGDDTWMSDAAVVTLQEQLVGRVRPTLLVLLAGSALLLVIACANVINLLVARMASREGEMALRLALGAGRGRLAMQLVAEAMVLSLSGGLLGVLLAAAGLPALLALSPGNLPRASSVHLSWPVLLFALGVSVLTAVALGLITALRGTRGELREAMAQSQRTQAGAGSSYRIRGTLVVSQVALTLILLVAAGLMGRSFLRLLEVEPGYRTAHAVVLDVSFPSPDTREQGVALARLYDDLIAGLRAIPGVAEVGGVNALPLTSDSRGDGTFLIMSRPDEPISMADLGRLMKDSSRTGEAEFRVASGGYFRAMNIPLVRGRLFDDRDGPETPHVAVISASLARARWPNEEPLGKVIQFGNMDGDLRPFTIVGVVGDVRETSLAADPRPTFYADVRQRPRTASTFNIVIQGPADPAAITAAARRVVRELRADIPPRVRTIEAVVAGSLADRRFMLSLLAVFGAAALLLATLGVYSVISYLVTQRRQELAVRVALGARTEDLLRLVLRQGVVLAVTGVVVGAVATLALTRLLSGFLFGVSATDPLAFGAVALLLTTVAVLASWIPARRAAAVDPMQVLRGG